MKIQLARIAFLAALAATAAVAVLAPAAMASDGFQPCPYPPCLAPCQFPPPPQVLCRTGVAREPFVTSFTCCCCGGGGGSNEYQWIDSK